MKTKISPVNIGGAILWAREGRVQLLHENELSETEKEALWKNVTRGPENCYWEFVCTTAEKRCKPFCSQFYKIPPPPVKVRR